MGEKGEKEKKRSYPIPAPAFFSHFPFQQKAQLPYTSSSPYTKSVITLYQAFFYGRGRGRKSVVTLYLQKMKSVITLYLYFHLQLGGFSLPILEGSTIEKLGKRRFCICILYLYRAEIEKAQLPYTSFPSLFLTKSKIEKRGYPIPLYYSSMKNGIWDFFY